MELARILAYVTGTVDQELLARNEYLAAQNRILKAQLNGRLKPSDADRATLGEIGHRLSQGSRRGRNRRPAGTDGLPEFRSCGHRLAPIVPSFERRPARRNSNPTA